MLLCLYTSTTIAVVFHPLPLWDPGLGHSFPQLMTQPLPGNCPLLKGPASSGLTAPLWEQPTYDDWSRSEYKLSVLLPPLGTSLKGHLRLTTPLEINWGLCCNKITVQVHLPSPASVTPLPMHSQGHHPINFLQQNLRISESVPLGTQSYGNEVMLSI